MVKFYSNIPNEDNKSPYETKANSYTRNLKNDIPQFSENSSTNSPLIPQILKENGIENQFPNSNNEAKNEKEIIPLKPKPIYANIQTRMNNYDKNPGNFLSIKIPKNLNLNKFKDDSLAELFHFRLSKYYNINSRENPKILYESNFKDENTNGNFGSIYSILGQNNKENEQNNISELLSLTKKETKLLINFGESLNKYYNKLYKLYFQFHENDVIKSEIKNKIIECRSIIKRQHIFEYIPYKKYVEEFNKKCNTYYISHSINSLINNKIFYEITKKIPLKINNHKMSNFANRKKIKGNGKSTNFSKIFIKKHKKKKFIRIGHQDYQILYN